MTPPFFVYEITPRCNSNCIFCYNVWKAGDAHAVGELTLPDIETVLDNLSAETRPSGITLTGGEPLLHPQVMDILGSLRRRGIRTGIATNGSLLDDEACRSVIAQGVRYFEVSLSGVNPGIYARITRSTHSAAAMDALLNVRKYGGELTVAIVLTSLNLPDLADTIDYCAVIGADSVALNRFVPGGTGLAHIDELELMQSELEQALAIADAGAASHNLDVNITIPVEHCLVDHGRYPHLQFGVCTCGNGKWAVDPMGNLRTCEQNPEVLGSLLHSSFSELASSDSVVAFRQDNLRPDCMECRAYAHCGGGCRFARR